MKKKVVSLLLAAAMVCSLAACGNGGSGNGSGSADNGSGTEAGTDGGSVAAADGTYTYRGYQGALATNWNPHTWESNADDAVIQYITTPLVNMTILNTDTQEYQWIYEAATSVEDVTADHQDDLVTYKSVLPAGVEAATDVTEGYVFEIGLRDTMTWEDGTPINADSYIYSMQQMLNPDMKNYRANNYYSGDYAVAGAYDYYMSKDSGFYVAYSNKYASTEEAAADNNAYIDVYEFYNAEGYVDADGNEVPQYVSITDETKYSADGAGEDEFSGADLWAGYAPYFTPEGGSDNVIYSWADNDNMGVGYDVVGFYKVDDYTVRYVCQYQVEKNYLLGQLASAFLVNEDKYEANKDTTGTLVTTSYGTSADTTMSYGPYKLASLQDGKQMVLEQNENWYGYTKDDNGNLISMTDFLVDGQSVQQYQTNSIVLDVMDDDSAKQAFLKGQLSEWTPSADDLPTYALSDQLYKVDETYTMRLFFDTNLDDLKEMDSSKGNTNSVVMSNVNFRKALSLCLDRSEYVGATKGYKPAFALLNSLYYYDAYNNPDSQYRNTEAAKQALVNVYDVAYGEGTAYATLDEAAASVNGYNLTEAKELMAQACQELVDAGLYTAGEDIYIRIGWAAGGLTSSDNQQITLLNKYVNAALEGSGFGKLTFEAIGNITNRYSDVANGEYAIGWGAWGGAAFYPYGYFRVFFDPDYTALNEAACWDPATETLTLNVNGEDVTMTWQQWSQSLEGVGQFANESAEVKCQVLALLEEAFLEKYYCIPVCSTTSCSMLAYQLSYYTQDYNIMYDFGGFRLIHYNYTDAEWSEYVDSVGGTLSYE